MALPDSNKYKGLTPEALMYASLGRESEHDDAVADALSILLRDNQMLIVMAQQAMSLIDILVPNTKEDVNPEVMDRIASMHAGLEKLLSDADSH